MEVNGEKINITDPNKALWEILKNKDLLQNLDLVDYAQHLTE